MPDTVARLVDTKPEVKELAAAVLRFFADDPARWTKGLLARDSQGRASHPTGGANASNDPVCWCVLGAAWCCDTDPVYRTTADALGHRFAALMEERLKMPFHFSVGAANDHPQVTFQDVVAVLTEIAG